jgi:hypothetical protein
MQQGDVITYMPDSESGTEGLDEFMVSEIISRLIETKAFILMSCFLYNENGESVFMTEIRPKDTAFIYVRFEHRNNNVISIKSQNQFDFDYIISIMDKEKRIRILYIMDILQKLCK